MRSHEREEKSSEVKGIGKQVFAISNKIDGFRKERMGAKDYAGYKGMDVLVAADREITVSEFFE